MHPSSTLGAIAAGLRARRRLLFTVSTPLLAAAPAAAFQVQALVARYDLDELVGPVAHDSSSNTEDGRYTTGVQLGLLGAAPQTGRASRFRAALGGHASVEEHAGLALLHSNVSVTAWIKPESDSGVMGIFGSSEAGWACARSDSGLRFTVRFVQDFVADCDVPLGQWTHVAFVFDSHYDVTFYVNGQNVAERNGIWPAYWAGPEWNVGSLDGQTGFWDGLLDDVQVYVGALTASEVGWLRANPGEALDVMVGTPYCFGDGHGTPCPCFNYGRPETGCANSTGGGARLRSGGSNHVGPDDLRFGVEGLPANVPALLFVGTQTMNIGNGVVFGDGLRCAQGQTRRLGIRHADPSGNASWSEGLRAQGGWNAGDTRSFQAWYRDPSGPCGTGFNLSQGIQISFVP